RPHLCGASGRRCLAATGFGGCLPGGLDQSRKMPFRFGGSHERDGGDDTTEFALGIENRRRLARQGGEQMFIEFGAARLADGFENAGSRRRAAKGGWLQPAHGSHPVRWQISLKNQTAGAVVQRQNIAKSDGADGKAG